METDNLDGGVIVDTALAKTTQEKNKKNKQKKTRVC